ncbi:flippase [uncultured Shewanella sp.]|uniref:flippase n=1 Tax=uncultured Shewanella sp. TaxID=173975 RepID=UPI00262C9C35|nr:flippase [uncultured Shewanella sp.]
MAINISNRFRNIQYSYKRVFVNFISLSVLQGMNYVLPLITLPYLIQVLGVEKFGLVSFATSIALYFGIISDYGYKLTAPRDIAKCGGNQDEINKIANVVFVSKSIILAFCFLFMVFLVNYISPFNEHKLIYIVSFFVIACQSFVPVWFFQGVEDMKYVTYINIFSKLVFLILVFTYISTPEDYYYVPIFTAVGFFISAFLSICKIRSKYNYKFNLPSIDKIKIGFKDGWEIFLGSAFTSLYTNSNIVILGLYTSPIVVGYYTIADKIVSAITGLFIPFNQAIYPFLAKKYNKSKYDFSKITLKLTKLLSIVSIILFFLFYISNESIVEFITSEVNSTVVLLVSIMSLRILSSPFSNLFSNVLIITGNKKPYLKVMKLTVIANVVVVFPAIYLFESIGLAIGFVTVLWLHTIMLYLNTKKISYEKV